MRNTSGALFLFLLIVSAAQPAYAYLEPGAGSVLLQLLFGGFAGAAFILKLYWQRVKNFLSFKKKSTDYANDGNIS